MDAPFRRIQAQPFLFVPSYLGSSPNMLRTSIAAAAAIAGLSSTALAQGNLLSQIPQCAQTCFGNSLGSCGPLDIGCICGNVPVITKVSCCVFATCSEAEIKSTTSFATNLCSLQGIQVNTNPDCSTYGTPSNATAPSNATGSASPSANATRPTASHSASSTSTAAAAPLPHAAAGLGLGAVLAVLFAYL